MSPSQKELSVRDQENMPSLENLAPWLGGMENIILNENRPPSLDREQGQALANTFKEAGIDISNKEFSFPQPEGTTEKPVMAAIEGALETVLGLEKEEIRNFVREQIEPLRKSQAQKANKEKRPANRFLVMAVENVISDILAVVRTSQKGEQQEAALSSLSLSLFIRLQKGRARENGWTSKKAHRENIWNLRGVRDLPPGSLREIGELLRKTLETRGKTEIPLADENNPGGRLIISRLGVREGKVAGQFTPMEIDNEIVLEQIVAAIAEKEGQLTAVDAENHLRESLLAMEAGEEAKINIGRYNIVPAGAGYLLEEEGEKGPRLLAYQETVNFLREIFT